MTKFKKVLYILVMIGMSSTMVIGQLGGGDEPRDWEIVGCQYPVGSCD